MARKRTLTEHMVMQIMLSLDPSQRQLDRICDELWSRFQVKTSRSTLSKWINAWDLYAKVEEAARIEAQKAVAAAMASAQVGELRDNIASLNRLEDASIAVLEVALRAIKDEALQLPPAQALLFLELGAKMILSGAQARKVMAEIAKLLPEAAKPTPEGQAEPADTAGVGSNVVVLEEARKLAAVAAGRE